MNSNPHNPKITDSVPGGPAGAGDETLRLIASLPAPAGLEDRVHTALRAPSRQARVLAWPKRLNPQSGWMRTAAAAAIVFVVVGGGWGVYTRVEHNQPAKVIVMPLHMPAAGSFSSAGAMRTPQTLPGPVVPHPSTAPAAQLKKNKKPVKTLRSMCPAGCSAVAPEPPAQSGRAK
jgi:hypothetical protein